MKLKSTAPESTFLSRLMLRLMVMMMAIVGGTSALQAQAPTDLINPNVAHPDEYISDVFGYMPAKAERKINAKLGELRQKTTCEMAVAIIRSTSGMPISDYAYELFRKWGIGKSDKNNGVLLIIAIDDRKAFIATGSGAEGVLTDIACSNIIRQDIRPAMRDNSNLSQAVNSAVESVYAALTDPAVAEELRSEQGTTAMGTIRSLNSHVIWQFVDVIVALVFLFIMGLFFVDLYSTRKRDNYRRAMIWRNHLSTYWWSAIFSLGTTLIWAVLAWILYHRARDVPEICTTCGAKMKKLSEEEDNGCLSDSQDFEEKLGTVDYDVWLCPECGTIERFPYVEKQLKYRECPHCHTIAMNLVCDKVVQEPTTQREGLGVKTYQCQYCRKGHDEPYRIPKKTDPTAAIAAGAVLGGMMRGGGGDGGNIGGGFGGGTTFGGGAGGGW